MNAVEIEEAVSVLAEAPFEATIADLTTPQGIAPTEAIMLKISEIRELAKSRDVVQLEKWAMRDLNKPPVFREKSDPTTSSAAECAARTVQLTELALRWDGLPPNVAVGILAMARSATG